MKENIQMSEREMMADGVASQKQIASGYNIFAGECSSNQLRDAFLNILSEEHDLCAELAEEMTARGWLQVKEAAQSEVAKTKQRFISSDTSS